ncbi:MAG: universal stress protein [Candidatus Thorarchaeota archaeon]
MNRILVAYDCSPEAKKALEHAITIAEEGTEIIVLTIIPDPEVVFGTVPEENISKDDVDSKLQSFKNEHDTSSVKLISMIIQGDIVNGIIRTCEEQNCRLIVLGYKGVSKIGNFKLGNISGEVSKKAKKPVLIIN